MPKIQKRIFEGVDMISLIKIELFLPIWILVKNIDREIMPLYYGIIQA